MSLGARNCQTQDRNLKLIVVLTDSVEMLLFVKPPHAQETPAPPPRRQFRRAAVSDSDEAAIISVIKLRVQRGPRT